MKKGFTLVELLAVIVVISVVLAIAVPKFLDFLESSKQESYEQTVLNIIEAAELYITDNHFSYINTSSFDITTSTLCTDKYLQCPIYDPNDSTVEMSGTVHVIYTDGVYHYSYIED